MSEEKLDGMIQDRDIVKEMKESYLNYSMSVIVSRALPDVRDGLKPVHRRVLFGAADLGAGWNRGYKKSARIVGEVMGKYHPHGDASIYDTLVRMAQTWSLRYPLIDGQGNFGSIDGDSAAAMRYTEARMQRITSEMMIDLEKETVTFQSNFDETLKEPVVLPTTIPNLLMNGSDGIAVGMATKIPPHNIIELISGLNALLENPQITIEELNENHIKGPDFPTGGLIFGTDGVLSAYQTGRGRIVMRAKTTIEELPNGKEVIIINEIPYQVNKSSLVEKIAHLARDKKLEGISDLRDESDRDGIRIVIECKKDAIASIVLNNLFKYSQLQETYGANMLSLIDGIPKVMNLKTMLVHFLDFRREVIVKRSNFELKEAEKRVHLLEGLKVAQENIDKVVKLIKQSQDVESAKNTLVKTFTLSDKQAKAILEMRLQRLTSLEVDKITTELKELDEKITHLQKILINYEMQSDIIRREFSQITERYGDERRTKIIPFSGELSIEDIIADEEMVVTISHNGYIKRLPISTWKTQRRGGRGMKGAATREDDFIEHLFTATTHNTMMFFTDKGKCYWLKVHEIPPGQRTSQGRAVVNLIGCDPGEKVKAFVSVKEFNETDYIVMATKNGMVKRSALSMYSRPRKGGIYAIEIRENDELIQAKISNGDQHIILATNFGKSIRFNESDVRSTGRKTMGVRGIRLSSNNDRVIGMLVVKREGSILVVTDRGFGKRTSIEDYRKQHRGGKGVITIKTTKKVGNLIAIMEALDSDDLMLITNQGIMIRQAVSHIRTIGRNTQGVKLARLDEGTKISSATRIFKEESSDEKTEETEETPSQSN